MSIFNVGDMVVYPMHGAGTIEAIEEKEVLGERKRYYVMRMPIGNMKLMVPLDNVSSVGLRRVITKEEADAVFEILENYSEDMSANWNRRYRSNLEKIKSGNIFKVSEVVRNLMLREREKGLSTGERKMLENSRQILISELVLARGTDEAEVSDFVESLFEKHQP